MNLYESFKLFIFKHWKSIIKVSVAGILLALIITEGHRQLKYFDLADMIHYLRQIPLQKFAYFCLFGIAATSTMIAYDLLVAHKKRLKIRPLWLICFSFVANSFNNLLGLGGIPGASVRSFFLRKNNVEIKEIIEYNVWIIPATSTGLSVLSFYLLFRFEVISSIVAQYQWLWIGIIGFMIYLPLYYTFDILISLFKKSSMPEHLVKLFTLKSGLLLVSTIEWIMAASFFYLMADFFNRGVSFPVIVGVFSLAAIAGIMSFIPGGFGSFDLVAVIGLQNSGIAPANSFVIVILFRLIYFLFPAFMSIILFSLNLIWHKKENINIEGLKKIRFFSNTYSIYSDFINILLSILVFSSGMVLLFSAIKPGIIERIQFATALLSFPLLQFSHVASLIIGILLLMTSKEILYKVQRAYAITLTLLIAGSVFTFLKGLDYEEAIFLIIVFLLLKFSKPSFYRKSIPFKLINLILVSSFSVVLIPIFLLVTHRLHFEFIIKYHYPLNIIRSIPEFFNAQIFLYLIFIIFTVLWYALQEKIEDDPLFTAPDFSKIEAFLEKHKGNYLVHLLFLGDKNIFWAVDGTVLIPFAKYKDIIVVLGDPLGEENNISKGIIEFQEFLDLYGYRCVFYQVSEKNLPVYHDNGYYFFKLGEEAVIDLEEFNLQGSSKSNFRNVLNRFKKDGYTFELLDHPFTSELFDQLEKVSNEWLGKRKEMGFSLGWFDRDYLQRSPIAVLRNSESEILAFVSLLPGYDQNRSISLDLMRFVKDVPNSTMDYLILNLLIHYKEAGYSSFNLSMAPLSNVGYAPNSHFQEKVARLVYHYGKHFYSFDGLRRYKEKFDPVWRPKYLAYPQLVSLPATIIQVSLLVSTAKKLTTKTKMKKNE